MGGQDQDQADEQIDAPHEHEAQRHHMGDKAPGEEHVLFLMRPRKARIEGDLVGDLFLALSRDLGEAWIAMCEAQATPRPRTPGFPTTMRFRRSVTTGMSAGQPLDSSSAVPAIRKPWKVQSVVNRWCVRQASRSTSWRMWR